MTGKVYAGDFTGANDAAIIQSAIDFAAKNHAKTVILDDKDYVITAPIQIKENVKLVFQYGTRFVIYGSFRVLELQKNASLEGAYIAIDDPAFESEVIYLDGKYNYYNTWYRTQVKDVTIVNWQSSHTGTGLSLYANGDGHEISFINFENIKIAGLNTALKLVAERPPSGLSWINGNRFINLSLDDCVEMIAITSNATIPNEVSGNQFCNLQMQTTPATKNLMRICGQFNRFDGMIWDIETTANQRPLIELTANSMDTVIHMPSAPPKHITDAGKRNQVNP